MRKSYGKHEDLNLKALIALMRASSIVKRDAHRTISRSTLTLPQFAVLEALYHKGDLRIKEIIDKVLSTNGNMTVIIENLRREGYVTKYKDPADGRASLISITEKGRLMIEELFPSHLAEINDVFNVLSEQEKEQLIISLKKLSSIL